MSATPTPPAAARDAAPTGAPLPPNEDARLSALRATKLLDSLPEQMFDDVVKVASSVCGAPIALVSLVDSDRQWFKAAHGLDATETPRSQAFCAHAILEPQQTMMVPDATQDARFQDNPLVTDGPHIRMYAGTPIVTHSGHAVGTVCVIDSTPRQLSPDQIDCLEALSRMVSNLIEYRRLNRNTIDSVQLQLLAKSDRLRAVQTQNESLRQRVTQLESQMAALQPPSGTGTGAAAQA